MTNNDTISRKLIIDYPITKFMDKSLFFNGCLKPNETVSVIYIGFDEMIRDIHYDNVRNNQLVTTNNGLVVPYIINYYAFDKDANITDEYYQNFNKEYKNYTNSNYFEAPDYPCFFKLEKDVDINSIIEIIKKNSYTNIYISSNNHCYISDILNIKDNKYHIFVANNDIKDERITTYSNGLSEEVNIEISRLVSIIMDSYSDQSGDILTKKLTINEASSLYAALNLRLKLNLLGYDYSYENNDNSKEIEDLTKILEYKQQNYEDYIFKDNKDFTISNALAYQEHLRWNAFYLYNGYLPLEISKIYYDNNHIKVIKDDHNKKLHACLTTTWGLDDYHRLCAKLLSENKNISVEEALKLTNSYKYDYMLIDNIKKIFKHGGLKLYKK